MNLFRGAAAILFVLFLWKGHAVPAGDHPMDIRFDAGKQVLSVHVSNTPLSLLLKGIGEKMDCKMVVFSSREDIITDSFLNIPVKQGIQRLAKNFSMAVIYRISDSGTNTKTLQEIREIWLFDGGNELRSSGTEPKQNTPLPDADLPEPAARSEINPEKGYIPQPSTRQANLLIRDPLDEETPEGFWAKRLFESEEYDDKAQAITELQRIGSEDVLPVIATVLGDKDAALRRHAVESLKLVDTEEAVMLIGQALLGDTNASVRKAALGYFSDRQNEVSKAFLNTALKDSHTVIRELARKSLELY